VNAARTYYRLRDEWNTKRASWSPARSAAALIALNKCGYNGLWRVNRRGHFNVPMGRYDQPAICVPEVLRAAHAALRHADLRAGDYRTTLSDAERGDLCYLDPPYAPLSRTASFTTYSANGFGSDDQRTLAEMARQLVARGCHVVLSNSDTPFVRDLYKDFRIDRVRCPRSISCSVSLRGEVDELIIVGAPHSRSPRSHRRRRSSTNFSGS
jgi:DNA adenine methylase